MAPSDHPAQGEPAPSVEALVERYDELFAALIERSVSSPELMLPDDRRKWRERTQEMKRDLAKARAALLAVIAQATATARRQALEAAANDLRDKVRLVPSLEPGKLYVQEWLRRRALAAAPTPENP